MIAVPCNLCGRDEWRVRYPATNHLPDKPDTDAFRCTWPGYGHHPQVVQCCHCGLVYANPRWVGDALLAAYAAVEDEAYLAERAGREKTFTRRLCHLEGFAGPGNGRRLLDVGAYIGTFVDVARRAGWQAAGVEPSRWAASVATENGLPVLEGTLDAPELRGQQYDVITMWDVIEHVGDPSAELAKAYRLLRPGGFLAVHTMDLDSLTARLMGHRWPWLMDMHVHYFSRRTLRAMLAQTGYEVIWDGPQGRYLRLGYVASRVAGLSSPAGRFLGGLIGRLGLSELPVWLNFGDLFSAYARRPPDPQRQPQSMAPFD